MLLGICIVPRAFENNALCKIWGANKVYYGECENDEDNKLHPHAESLSEWAFDVAFPWIQPSEVQSVRFERE